MDRSGKRGTATVSRVTALFPLWALLASGLAYWQPQWLIGAKPAIVPLLGLVMLDSQLGRAIPAIWATSWASKSIPTGASGFRLMP